ncbi:MAG: curli production assembly protein CsgF [Pseudomonas sp.]|jgi:curli production assembly/transport component CsgF|uniref:curli assembly protein CsgF n=1 Tax=Pseudomonadaceae TaxID=135621 RepID=UPI00051DA145|nr:MULTISPECIES: curli assembly protein CsgF [Pseudomonadaceae]MCF6753902.1 curli assembly protein CsgF [Stutzerimonas stutzeri]MDT3709257.1 curli assembly protein CsgF [Pseudomonadaceae bacterium]KGK84652.1 curli production assembly protein CsgF [Stutzerimonas degradans]MBV2206221.1 curli assembly protein CsgF [Pseudomonas sp.]MCQ4265966.1 curli assembly protein CsgF [Stutzerimonas degradans]
MNRHIPKNLGVLAGALLLSAGASATELVYTPINPSFGGSPLNGSWLLGNAQAQNDHKDPDAPSRSASSLSALDRFTSQLESRLLSDLLVNVGNGETGSLTTDDFIVDVTENDLGDLVIVITDRATGETSEVVVGQN